MEIIANKLMLILLIYIHQIRFILKEKPGSSGEQSTVSGFVRMSGDS